MLSFQLKVDTLGFLDRSGESVLEPGDFEVLVGGSSREQDMLRARFRCR